MRAPLDDPKMAGFMARIEEIDALASLGPDPRSGSSAAGSRIRLEPWGTFCSTCLNHTP
jgi:hypothetical protein